MRSLSNSALVVLALGAFLLASACKRKGVVAPGTLPPVEAPTALATPPPASVPPSLPPGTTVTTRESNDAAYIQEMTQTLNDFLGDYIKQHKRVPKDINEMVSLKLITSIPVLPGGKKWVINQQTGKISAQ